MQLLCAWDVTEYFITGFVRAKVTKIHIYRFGSSHRQKPSGNMQANHSCVSLGNMSLLPDPERSSVGSLTTGDKFEWCKPPVFVRIYFTDLFRVIRNSTE